LVGRRRGTLPRVKNTKVTGERSEANFLYKAANRNFGIAKPWGDSRKYDFILDSGSLLNRMQIKCTECIRAGAYETRATYTVGKGRAVYTKKDIDFIAAHVVPLDIWYIIPVEVCTRQPMLRFYPHRKAKNMRLEKYREAWHLLTAPEDHETIEIQAVADETVYSDLDTEDLRALLTELKDPAAPGRMKKNGKNKTGKKKTGKTNTEKKTGKKKPARSKPIRLPKSAAPWPIPALKVLKARTGKRILPAPDVEEK
jgi:hypothetical protein